MNGLSLQELSDTLGNSLSKQNSIDSKLANKIRTVRFYLSSANLFMLHWTIFSKTILFHLNM
jgi:hypothetical protein